MTNLEFDRIIFTHTENKRIHHVRNMVEIAYKEDDFFLETHTCKWLNLPILQYGRITHLENGRIFHQLKMLEKQKGKIIDNLTTRN